MTAMKKCKVCGKPFTGEGEIGPTCAEHAGLVGRYYVVESGAMNPEQFIYLTELCDMAEDYGKSRYWMVKRRVAMRVSTLRIHRSLPFTVFNGRKCCRREAIATMRTLAQQKP